MEVLFLMSIFRLRMGLKMSFENNVTKNLSACFRWFSRLSLNEMGQQFTFGGTIGYGDSYSGFLIRHFKIFRLHAKLYDAARAGGAHSGKRTGYC